MALQSLLPPVTSTVRFCRASVPTNEVFRTVHSADKHGIGIRDGPDFGYADALFEVASAQGNVGLSSGITGPGMSPVAEGMFVLNMWIGRLEIIPVLVFVRAGLYGLTP